MKKTLCLLISAIMIVNLSCTVFATSNMDGKTEIEQDFNYMISQLKKGNLSIAKEHIDFENIDDNVVSKMSQYFQIGKPLTGVVKDIAKDIPIVGNVIGVIGGIESLFDDKTDVKLIKKVFEPIDFEIVNIEKNSSNSYNLKIKISLPKDEYYNDITNDISEKMKNPLNLTSLTKIDSIIKFYYASYAKINYEDYERKYENVEIEAKIIDEKIMFDLSNLFKEVKETSGLIDNKELTTCFINMYIACMLAEINDMAKLS